MSRMRNVGDVAANREHYLTTRYPNLTYLFHKRMDWMNRHIRPGDEVLEVGCGIGVTRLFVTNGNLTLSDVEAHPWVDRREDAMDLSFADDTVDVVIANNMIHHIPRPIRFVREAHRVLKPGGKLLIQEVNCSLMLRAILIAMRHESYDFSADVFDPDHVCTDEENPWAGNNAIPNLLFDDKERFERQAPSFEMIEKRTSEFLVFLNSGGVTAKTFSIRLPRLALRCLDGVDGFLCATLPRIFALQMRVVLVKR